MGKIGILTGGGDCPGLNAVIRAVVEKCAAHGTEVYGFRGGWRGALTGEGDWLTLDDVENLQAQGGTLLFTSRTNVLQEENGPERVRATMEKLGLNGIVAIGGDDTLGVADKLNAMGMNMIGVPKTIDNDLSGTDFTFGFDTAANIAMEAIDRIHTTAYSHRRYIVVELMGRHTGWIALYAGLAGCASVVLIPEFPKTVEEVAGIMLARKERGLDYGVIAVAEGCEFADMELSEANLDEFGNVRMAEKDVAARLADALKERTGIPTRHTVLGYLQRAGAPSVFDRILGTRLGYKAAECVVNEDYGHMIALQGNEIVAIPLSAASQGRKEVGKDLYACAELYFR